MIYTEICLPQGEKLQSVTVLARSKESDGNIIGTYGEDPKFNTLVYYVEFPDSEVKEYAANIIAENMLAQVDEQGYYHTILDIIIDYKKDSSALERNVM